MEDYPEKLGKYDIMGVAGRGSMGVVYLGHDPFVDRKVAVKVCTLEEEEEARARVRKMFFNEAQAAGNLDHPNILKVYDAGEADGEPYIVMEYVAGGETLRTYCDADRLLPIERVVEMVAHCAKSLHYAHAQGVTHRDIKPANIMLSEGGVVKIGDFGIAQRTHTDKTQVVGVYGSPRYMSPEQAGDRLVGGQSDLFSLGVVLYELLTGKPPFMAKNLPGLVYKILHDPPQPIEEARPDLPASLVKAVNHALEKDTAKRYKTGEEMAADLNAIFEELNRPFTDRAEDEQLLVLQQLRFFEDFSESEVAEVLQAGILKTFPVGEQIIREGAEADGFYIIISGHVRVAKNGRQVAMLSAGDSFGEMGYLSDMARSAAVLAVGSVTVLRVDADVKEWASFPCQVRLTKTFQRILIERLARITDEFSLSGS